VSFDDGRSSNFDAIVVATGFRPGIAFLEPQHDMSRARQAGITRDEAIRHGLYFCGFIVSPTGMLREIGLEAHHIAEDIAAYQH
jgi:hypothetical protein